MEYIEAKISAGDTRREAKQYSSKGWLWLTSMLVYCRGTFLRGGGRAQCGKEHINPGEGITLWAYGREICEVKDRLCVGASLQSSGLCKTLPAKACQSSVNGILQAIYWNGCIYLLPRNLPDTDWTPRNSCLHWQMGSFQSHLESLSGDSRSGKWIGKEIGWSREWWYALS